MTSDNPQTSSSVMEDRAGEATQTSAPSSNSEAFAELSRLAKESTSSWGADAPGRKTDRAFLMLIVIAIILLSGIIMIASYREQISEKFDALMSSVSQPGAVETGTDNRMPTQPPAGDRSVKSKAPSSAELEIKIRSLEERLAQLQLKLEQLETGAPTPDIAAPVSTPVSAIVLDGELPVQESESVQPELDQTPVSTSPSADKTSKSAISLAREASDAGTLITVAPVEPVATSPTPAPTMPVELEPAVSETTVSDQATEAEASPESLPDASDWYINLAAYSQQASAKPLYERTRQIGKADIQEVVSGTRTVYRVRAIGYSSAEEARKDAQRIESLLGLKDTWISNK